MSRCFPYRPTLCARNGGSGEEALIETIKLHCKEDKSKPKSLKDKKRERKEKKKERRENEVKPYGISDGNVTKHDKNVKCSQDENNSTLFSKKSEDEEHSEKSGLTDEHDEPVCYLSDGTQSSNKRKRQPSISLAPSTTSSITVHKNILRIRLPSLKHRESDPSLCKGQSCPTVGSTTADSHVREVAIKEQCQIKNSVEDASPISDTLRMNGITQFDASTCNGTTLYTKKVPDAESFYRALIEDRVPPPIQSWLSENDNEDWLFGTKCQSQGPKRLKTRNDVSCCQSSTPWPCAHHLQEADVYALPYSIPF